MRGQPGEGDGTLELQNVPLGFAKGGPAASSVSTRWLVTFTVGFGAVWTFRHCLSVGASVGDVLVKRGTHVSSLSVLRGHRQAARGLLGPRGSPSSCVWKQVARSVSPARLENARGCVS